MVKNHTKIIGFAVIVFLIINMIRVAINFFIYFRLGMYIATTITTSVILCFVVLFKFENLFFNTIAGLNIFIFIQIIDYYHYGLVIIQILLICSKIKIKKEYLYYGFFFWLIYCFSIDDITRIFSVTWLNFKSKDELKLYIFITLIFTIMIEYYIKNYWKCIMNG